MSGYLQRIAMSTLNPGGSIRPVLGSLFSSPRCEDSFDRDRDRFHGDDASRKDSQFVDDPAREITEIVRPFRARSTPTFSTVDHASQQTPRTRFAETRAAIEFPKPLVVDRLGASQTTIRDRDRSRDPNAVESLRGTDEGMRRAAPRPSAEPSVAAGEYQPILPESARVSTFSSHDRHVISASSMSREQSARNVFSQQRQERVRHDAPNDVEIHIGRIEVIAVPQAVAQPPPARPAAKSPSLNDYLKRRDPRAL
jgi:hypothetical protein